MITAPDLSTAIDWAKSGRESMVKCPAHDDGQASLHVAPGSVQPVVMMCHAGCETDQILAAADVPVTAILGDRDETKSDGEWTPAGTASHVYPYYDEEGTLLYEVLRVPLPAGQKTFRQRRPDPSAKSGWGWNLQGVRRVLYRLPEVLAAKEAGRLIYVVEGEKDVESLRARGEVATTSPQGAGKWQDDFSQALAGANVAIISDADATGRAHARAVRESLEQHGCTVRNLEPVLGCKDVTDHLRAGNDLDALIETMPEHEEARASYGIDINDAIEREFPPSEFIIPDVLARGDRLLLTGFEGTGKSEWLRQIAMQVAAGIHPWTREDMQPRKVLVIDSENAPQQTYVSWRNLYGLAAAAGRKPERGALTILEEWDSEIDLADIVGRAWLIERIHAYRPDLVVVGPLYNLSAKDLSDHDTVNRIKSTVNEARSLYGTAFLMEHHAPHKHPTDKNRSVRPYGSSTFLKWPDYGFGLKPTEQEGVFEFEKTRWPRVRSRHFPEAFRWGEKNSAEWPWEPTIIDEDGSAY